MTKIILFYFLQASSVSAFTIITSGQQVGNGGHVVLCQPLNENEPQEVYALDYFVTADLGPEALIPLRPIEDWSVWSQNLLTILKNKNVFLAESLENFLLFTNNDHDYSQKRIWIESDFDLTNKIRDNFFVDNFPLPCLDDYGEPNIRQIIQREKIRDSNIDFISYFYH